MLPIPAGKTAVILTRAVYQSDLDTGQAGYIDGYVRDGDGVPYAIVVRLADGLLDFAPLHCLKACQS